MPSGGVDGTESGTRQPSCHPRGGSRFVCRGSLFPCDEVFGAVRPLPEGNGQGLTEDEALQSLGESILLLLEDLAKTPGPAWAAGKS